MKTHSKKAKKYSHTKDCKEQPRQDRLAWTYEHEETCRDEEEDKKEVHAARKLRREVEKVKKSLSTAHKIRKEVESRFEVESRLEEVKSRFEEEEFSETLTRAQFEKPNTDLFKETLKLVPKVPEDADLTKRKTDEIVPGGDSTRIPTVQQGGRITGNLGTRFPQNHTKF